MKIPFKIPFDFLRSVKIPVSSLPYLGVDIGTTSIKMVEVIKSYGGGPVLKNYGILESYGHLERQNNVIQTSSLKMVDKETAELLRGLFTQLNTTTVDVVASLPSFLSFTALLDLPAMSPEETAQAIAFQARSLVPLPIGDVTIDWLTVGEYEDEKGMKKQEIFLISVPNEEIKKYQSVFFGAGLNLKALEVEGVSLARILTYGDKDESLIIDIGARSTTLAVGKEGTLRYSSQSDFGGSSLTQAIASGLNINVRRAEELKRQRGLKGTGGEYELSTLMVPYLDVILNEGKRVKDNYEKNYRGKIQKIILSGGGANLLGLEKYASEYFGLPAFKADPWKLISLPPEAAPVASELGVSLSVGLGLGIKQFL